MPDLFPDPSGPLLDVEISRVIDLLVDPSADHEAKIRFLATLHARGESAGELAGFARHLLGLAVPVEIPREGAPILELCGTGGDRSGFINVSTAAMFVAAGAGARVVKHGNRAMSSRCGSADVLEALGVPLDADPSLSAAMLEKAGCVFLLASHHHPVFASLAPLRREMASRGILTVFNLLGPLLNPALPDFQLTGVYRGESLGVYAAAMSLLGRKRAWAVHGTTVAGLGLDEMSLSGDTKVASVGSTGENGAEFFETGPERFGLSRRLSDDDLVGGDAPENARRILAILGGEESGSARDMVVLNAAAALHVAGIGKDPVESAHLAAESIDSGRALRSLSLLRGSV
jgi:anthranilate phosphoribosyltransferase